MAYGELSETQLALLDCLIYIDDVVKIDEGEKVTVGEVVKSLLANNAENLDKNKDPDGGYPATIPRERWIDILKAIQADEQLCNLVITHPINFKEDGYIEVDGEKVKYIEIKTPFWNKYKKTERSFFIKVKN
ncbi:hypothetical protein [Defluviitalea phaphyphila]|uniref:hypothetical protein n=1 Tax=Defluviitalea phaphyphila TaxID=1473580 RepID=UPI0007306B72|nr:hypothetical protein [Defluviitalea phaphyphila]